MTVWEILAVLSYAQNQEDVVLMRLTSLVPVGTFIDVGAGHPVLDNVTYALYQSGWRGINVEPMPREAGLLREHRPEDQIVQAACGALPGSVTLFEAPLENRGATTSDPDLVAGYAQSGQSFSPFETEVITLASLLDQYEAGAVHVVKIDVEGMEREVIAGAELTRTRPWVLVVEATTPNTRQDSSGAWESDVVEAGYERALFDGLNRFYVRGDLEDVRHLFEAPANVFDGWRRASEARLEGELERAASELARLHDEVRALHGEVARQHAAVEQAHRDAGEAIADLQRRCATAEAYAKSLEEERERRRSSGVG